jgi:hypothetical protein
MRLKNAVFRYNKKAGKSVPEATKRKWRKTPTDSTVIEPKYVRIPIFLNIPRALE